MDFPGANCCPRSSSVPVPFRSWWSTEAEAHLDAIFFEKEIPTWMESPVFPKWWWISRVTFPLNDLIVDEYSINISRLESPFQYSCFVQTKWCKHKHPKPFYMSMSANKRGFLHVHVFHGKLPLQALDPHVESIDITYICKNTWTADWLDLFRTCVFFIFLVHGSTWAFYGA